LLGFSGGLIAVDLVEQVAAGERIEMGIEGHHEELCERARRWLRTNRRCEPVFSNIASCGEIPDAIGWSSSWKHQGSILVECKASLSDFHADKWKYIRYKHPTFDSHVSVGPAWRSVRELEKEGYTPVPIANMGDFRFFMCYAGVIPLEIVEKSRPDHGLLWVDGRRVKVLREAPKREESLVDLRSEIRYLRFAIINGKQAYIADETEQPNLTPAAGEMGITTEL
jgi:hypothetical protein